MTTTDLLAAARRVAYLGPGVVRCGDRTVTAAEDTRLRAVLHAAVYDHVYLGRPRPPAADADDRRLALDREDPAFVSTLRAADGGRRRWLPGWLPDRADGDRLTVTSIGDGVRVTVTAAEVREAAVGVEVSFPTERRFVSAGFYLTTGLAGSGTDDGPVLRWYLGVTAAAAAPLLRALVRELDAAGLPFTVKTLNDPDAHPRPDALVLYTPRAAAASAGSALMRALDEPGVTLRPEVPAFTRALAPGIAIADEPPRGPGGAAVSFGQHRCLLLVQGVLAAGPGAGLTHRWERVRTEFVAAGLDPDRPHLSPGAAEPDVRP